MIVGKPLALLLMQKAPAECHRQTVFHSRSRISQQLRVGRYFNRCDRQAQFVRQEHVRDGAVVIDVGINRGGRAHERARLSARGRCRF